MSEHSVFAPSSMTRRFYCPGSAAMEDGIEETEISESAKRGTNIHEIVSMMISGNLEMDKMSKYSEEEIAIAEECYQYFAQRKKNGSWNDSNTFAELKMEYETIEGVLYWGTVDVVSVNGEYAEIIDWKTGNNFVEDAEINKQGMGYALLVAQKFNVRVVDVTFFNPVIKQVSRFTFDNIRDVAEIIIGIIDRCRKEPNCRGCGDHCKYCKAKGICPEFQAYSSSALTMVEMSERYDIKKWNKEKLSEFLELLPFLEKRIDEIKDEAMQRAERGELEGYEVSYMSGGRTVSDMGEFVKKINSQFSIDFGEFVEKCCKISLPSAKRLFSEKAKGVGVCDTLKNGEKLFDDLTIDCTVENSKRKKLKKIKKEIEK